MDGDGEKELAVLAPFHGEKIDFYKKKDGRFEHVYSYGKDAEFVHAIWGGDIGGVPTVIIGHRKETGICWHLPTIRKSRNTGQSGLTMTAALPMHMRINMMEKTF